MLATVTLTVLDVRQATLPWKSYLAAVAIGGLSAALQICQV
jgi:hypothetical protein